MSKKLKLYRIYCIRHGVCGFMYCLGEGVGRSFKSAVRNFAKANSDFDKLFDNRHFTWNGAELYGYEVKDITNIVKKLYPSMDINEKIESVQFSKKERC